MTGSGGWRPRASMATLRLRADLLASIREFFMQRNVLEVETPTLSIAGCTDPNIEPVTARVQALGKDPYYLATSPEHAMKRLLAAGSGDIYQLCRVYRDSELGRWHQPEFTLLEWYRVGWDEQELMAEVDELLKSVLAPYRTRTGTTSLGYREAFHRYLSVDPADAPGAIRRGLAKHGVHAPGELDSDGLLDLALGTVIAPRFDPDRITFVHGFPASQAALARIGPNGEAARFEAFTGGLELANGYRELVDAREQQARFEREQASRRGAGRPAPPLDKDLIAALRHGLPDCSGVAVGVDRLVSVAAGLQTVADSMSFPH